jgi:hypothetical protein
MTHSHPTALRALAAIAILSILGLAACTSAGASTEPSITAASAPPPAATATAEPSMSEAPSAAASEPADASEGPSAVATAIDPCQLITSDEVATVTGAQFGPPSSTTMENNGRICTYGQEGLGFNVIVVQAPDAATAKAEEPAFKAQLEQEATTGGIKNMKLTELPDFEPGIDAAILSGSVDANGIKVGGVAFYALKGSVLLALTELVQGANIATDAAMEAEAKTVLGRLP